jgi:hypothetical protein
LACCSNVRRLLAQFGNYIKRGLLQRSSICLVQGAGKPLSESWKR